MFLGNKLLLIVFFAAVFFYLDGMSSFVECKKNEIIFYERKYAQLERENQKINILEINGDFEKEE